MKNLAIKDLLFSLNALSKRCALKKSLMISVIAVSGLISTSCSPHIWMAIAAGILQGTSGQNYNTSYPYGSGTYYSDPSVYSSSSSSSTPSTCSRCNGTGNCKTCGGTGRKYDYGPLSVTTHEKYDQRCGVCNGSGKCGVCDGKGHI